MKMKKLFAILLASSLANTASSSASELEDRYEDQYYVGLNFGAGWGDTFKTKPSVVFGYNYDKNSKFELEVLANVSDITDKQKRKAGASLLVNYRYYPDLEIDPIKLYASIGLSGYIQVLPSFGFGGSSTGETTGENVSGNGGSSKNVSDNDDSGTGVNPSVGENVKEVEEETQKITSAAETSNPSLADKVLSSVSYKVKLGVDYEFTPQIVGTVAIDANGQLSAFKPPVQIPDAIIEVGIRYNF
ncbi:cell envelope biogenesis protein OmpA [Wolbachia endosymbiont of Bemisia tabaci]|uniref:porin family protein n=1 Tax=Wolbachia endosymbiont of Bemisia tabaci TaxID=215173 RepID=UPI000FD170CC|nr:porin family protein [Wolbachia endosymbiont of Bemisia tabaci]AZU37975.1 cell envelope biogenesis protein OmpA [Wolbachia endosymbiont of Bemisia tabaci]